MYLEQGVHAVAKRLIASADLIEVRRPIARVIEFPYDLKDRFLVELATIHRTTLALTLGRGPWRHCAKSG
jgi:hypothetical protein